MFSGTECNMAVHRWFALQVPFSLSSTIMRSERSYAEKTVHAGSQTTD